jgi:hypothetical protein
MEFNLIVIAAAIISGLIATVRCKAWEREENRWADEDEESYLP